MTLDSVLIENSEDLTVRGHGLYCDTCSVFVTNSTFRNLRSFYGPALYIISSSSRNQYIETSTFDNNTALGKAGAVGIKDAGVVHFRHNKFVSNTVSDDTQPITDWRFCDSGAIHF